MEHRTPQPLRTALTGVFYAEAVGRARALTLARLMSRAVIGSFPERTVREAIAELVVLDRQPIAGDASAGYYRCETAAERRSQMAQLVSRIRSLARRVRTFADVTQHEQGGQAVMDWSLDYAELRDANRLAERVLAAVGDGAGEDDE